jgi:hypothetical protein
MSDTGSHSMSPACPEEEEGRRPETPVRGISAVVFKDADRREMLLGVRRATPVNRRHPGVLSTPTIRLPAALCATVSAEGSGGRDLPIGHGRHHVHPAVVLIEFLLARKLELGAHLTAGRFLATARFSGTQLDEVPDPLGTGQSEWTELTTFVLTVTAGADLVPRRTAAFSRILWADADRVVQAYTHHDALMVDDSLDPFEVCIDGLCVRSAVSLLGAPT